MQGVLLYFWTKLVLYVIIIGKRGLDMKRDFLLAVDLDGTLIKNFDEYDQESFEYLRKISKTNKIIIATGRPWRSSRFYYEMLDLDTPIINYNGALVHNPKNPAFKKTMITISRNVVIDLIRDMGEILINVFCEIEDEIFLWKETAEIGPYLHSAGGILNIGAMEGILYGNPNGAIVLSKAGSEERLSAYVNDKYGKDLNIRIWSTGEIVVSEIYNHLTSKGRALAEIADFYKIPQEKIIAIGDGHNDLEMITYAGVGVAMENAHPELLNKADYITGSIDSHGVRQFLKNFFE